MSALSFDHCLEVLRASAEPTRLRILALMKAGGELTVSDLVDLLGQSQPRISRHLKLLLDAGLLTRVKEGAWAFFRLAAGGPEAELLSPMLERLLGADPVLAGDRERLGALRATQAEEAQAFFRRHAADWDRLRALHSNDEGVEAAIVTALKGRAIRTLLDLGTGTGRMLELFAPMIERGIGLDMSPEMLKMARAKLAGAGITHCEVRQGDLYHLALPRGSVDAVIIHQVLHFLDDGARAVKEAARVLRPGGRMVVVDFAPHSHEFLRERQAHRRLGFARATVEGWLAEAGLEPRQFIQFAPAHLAGEALTISLWVADDPRQILDAPVGVSSSIA